MRILMVSKACLVGSYYQRKLEEIARQPDVVLTVIVPPSWKDAQGELKLERVYVEGYRLLADPIVFNGRYHLHFYPRLGKRISEFRPDLLHIDEEPYNFATWHAWRLARRAKIKTLFFSWQNLERRYPFPFSLMERQVLQGVDHAIVGSQGSADVWRRKGYGGPLAIVPQFGVDPEIFIPAGRRDSGRGFVIGYVGRLVPEKGVDVLIRAASGLPAPWRLAIAGDGPERATLLALAKQRGVQDQVHLDGQLPSTRVPAYLQRMDVLVLPSRSRPNWAEQFGRVLTEAMACGIVVLGSRSGEIPQVIGEAGWTFPEDNVDTLREQLLRLMQDTDLRAELGSAGRQRVLEKFTQARVAADTVQVYKEILA